MTATPETDPAPAAPSRPLHLKDLPDEILIATMAGAQGGLSVVEGQMAAINERIGTLNVKANMDPKRRNEILVRQSELANFMMGLKRMHQELTARIHTVAHARPGLFMGLPEPNGGGPHPTPKDLDALKVEMQGGSSILVAGQDVSHKVEGTPKDPPRG